MELITTGSPIQPRVKLTPTGFVELSIGRGKFVMSHIVAEELAIALNHAVEQVDAMRKGA